MHKKYCALDLVSTPRQSDEDSVELDRVPTLHSVIRPERLVALTDPGSVGAEKFRAIAIRLRHFQERQPLKRLLITSSIKGEGKSVVAANLAVTLASQAQTVLLVDCDLHQSGLREVFGAYDQVGIGEWWKGKGSAISFFRRLDHLSLWYLSAGQSDEPPLKILQSGRFCEMLNHAASLFDWVIIDSAPLVPVADASFLATQVDATLLIVRQRKTPKSLLQEALKTENLKLLGIVANDWENIESRYYGRYYSSYSSSRNRELSNPKRSSLTSGIANAPELS